MSEVVSRHGRSPGPCVNHESFTVTGSRGGGGWYRVVGFQWSDTIDVPPELDDTSPRRGSPLEIFNVLVRSTIKISKDFHNGWGDYFLPPSNSYPSPVRLGNLEAGSKDPTSGGTSTGDTLDDT